MGRVADVTARSQVQYHPLLFFIMPYGDEYNNNNKKNNKRFNFPD